jgi:DNA polymerase
MSVRPLFDLTPVLDVPERGRTLSCVSCGLYRDVLTPRMPPHGENRRSVMVVGEGPGETEDERGRPWVGRAGRLLRMALDDFGLDLDRDCVSLNSVNCRPPSNRAPTGHEVACCRSKVVSPAVERYTPRVILLMGGSAVTSVLGPLCPEALGASSGKKKAPSIGKWRGMTIPVPEWGAWVCPTHHPSYVLREEKRPEVDTVWRQDVRRALKLLDTPVPPPEDLRSEVEVLRVEVDILRAIYHAHDAQLLSYDYETTGLRASLHKIVCVSFATSADKAYAFMMPESGPIRGAWSKLMVRHRVGKISHHMKFENEWTIEHFEVEEINWAWDSMLAAHVVDNRVGICGLKHQAFLNFGIRSWDGLIAPYLESVDEKDPTAPNRIWEFIERYGEEECLIYCGIDSLVAFRLAMRQREIIGVEAHHEGADQSAQSRLSHRGGEAIGGGQGGASLPSDDHVVSRRGDGARLD